MEDMPEGDVFRLIAINDRNVRSLSNAEYQKAKVEIIEIFERNRMRGDDVETIARLTSKYQKNGN